MAYSKIVNFDRPEAGLKSKWGRIWPAVQWCYQKQSNCTVRRHVTSLKNLLHTHTCGDTHRHVQNGLYSEVALAKKNPFQPLPFHDTLVSLHAVESVKTTLSIVKVVRVCVCHEVISMLISQYCVYETNVF